MLGMAARLAGAAFMKAPLTTTLIGAPSLLAATEYVKNMPKRTANELVNERLETDPDNFSEFGSEDANALQKLILSIGGGDKYSLDSLDDKFSAKRKTQIEKDLSTQRGLLQTTGDTTLASQAEIGLGESGAAATGRLNALMPRVEEINTKRREDAAFGSQAQEYARGQNAIQMRMLMNNQDRQLQETIDSRVGSQRLQEMQLLQMKENQADKMDLYRQQMTQKSADDRYRMTQGLIGGLSALGAAFAL